MSTTFDAWLRECTAAQKGGAGFTWYATRGTAFSWILRREGSWAGTTMRAILRSQPDAAVSLAEFTESAANLVTIDGAAWTEFTFTLAAGPGANSTASLPADGDADGLVQLALLIWETPAGGSEDFFAGGTFVVMGG